ncbi:MAG: heme exporter protein CcmD [Methylococcales bacterium]
MGQFNDFSEFLAMGGHGLYVWLCYGLVFLILIINIMSPWLTKRRIVAEQKRRIRRGDNNES